MRYRRLFDPNVARVRQRALDPCWSARIAASAEPDGGMRALEQRADFQDLVNPAFFDMLHDSEWLGFYTVERDAGPSALRRSRVRAISEQSAAQLAPTHHPPTTSLGQCTPRYTREKPIARVRKMATVMRNILAIRSASARARSAPIVK
jgi:hypothetical protein